MKKKKEKLVCVRCGNWVDGFCDCLSNNNPKYSFCSNCGDTGSHQRFIEVSKWKIARKILGLSTKINSYE